MLAGVKTTAVSTPCARPPIAMISSSTGINPASAAIMEISQATFTPCENIRRVSAMISGGFIPPNLLVIPRPTPLNA